MQRTRRSNLAIVSALLTSVWLVCTPPAAGIESIHQRAVVAERISTYTTKQTFETHSFDAPSSPLEEQFFADAADGRLDRFAPFDAALVAGGVRDFETLQHYRWKAAALAEEFRRLHPNPGTPRQQAEAVFEFMHRNILYGGYDLAYTDLRRVLDEGRFNCVSATVLFNYLAEELGLVCHGLEMPGHAMSRILLPSGTFDIENTCPRWFHLNGDSDHPMNAVGQMIGTAATADRSKAREVSPIQLAAMIYYNRGVDFLTEKRFDEAVRANAKALRLDPGNATARGNLLATINNWSIELGNRGQFAEAIDLLQRGLAMDATFAAFAQNFVHVHHQWAESLCQQGRYAEAIDLLARASAEMPDREYLRKAQGEVRQRWAKAAVGSSAE
jgi:tetratricopeptide (TPR) repeat protein